MKNEHVYQQTDITKDEQAIIDKYSEFLEETLLDYDGWDYFISSTTCESRFCLEEFALSKLRYEEYHGIVGSNDGDETEAMYGEHIVQELSNDKTDEDSYDEFKIHAAGISFARKVFAGYPCIICTEINSDRPVNHFAVCGYAKEKPIRLQLDEEFCQRLEDANDEVAEYFHYPFRLKIATKVNK